MEFVIKVVADTTPIEEKVIEWKTENLSLITKTNLCIFTIWCNPVGIFGAFPITIFGAYSVTDYNKKNISNDELDELLNRLEM